MLWFVQVSSTNVYENVFRRFGRTVWEKGRIEFAVEVKSFQCNCQIYRDVIFSHAWRAKHAAGARIWTEQNWTCSKRYLYSPKRKGRKTKIRITFDSLSTLNDRNIEEPFGQWCPLVFR